MAFADAGSRRASATERPPTGGGQSFAVTAPSLSLPNGGGAIRGIGEKFAANPVTGTGSMSVPIAASPGRSGFGPQLSLNYDSGAGNGPFGFGWSLSLPSITRKTDKGLPRYDDATESDVFLLSGVEDLVPALGADGRRHEDRDTVPGYVIHRYRPRIEGLFARIERWTRLRDGDIHWRSWSKDNVLTIYGADENSRIADLTPVDPAQPQSLRSDPRRVFSWLICQTRDDKGNTVVYRYKKEDGHGVDPSRPNERNRDLAADGRRSTNRYLKRILYGNRVPLLDEAGKRPRFLTTERFDAARWMFELVFDYGEHDAAAPEPGESGPWTPRSDPFSTYRPGFEVRTTRLCRRVLMFHHFPADAQVGSNCLIRSTDFRYSDEEKPPNARDLTYTFLKAVTHSGYRRRDGGGYVKRSMPPVEFEYSEPVVQAEVEEVDAESLQNLPAGLSRGYQWVDLHGEGIPGILTEQAGAWSYKRNLSPLPLRDADGESGNARVKARFAPIETVALRPNLTLVAGAQFMDLAGDGSLDLVVMDGPTPGLYEHDEAEGWQPFRPFTSRLNRSVSDPSARLIDLDGDGHADLLITEDDAFVWHASLAEQGFAPARRVARALDEEHGPRVVFAETTQSIYLADMSGDGLTDIVRIRNGEVCYWPNLGHGYFGAKVTMDTPPWFDEPDQLDPKRLRLADIDGSGTTDLIYLHRDGVRLYFNQSGNGWREPVTMPAFPRVDDLADISAIDLLGNGTACLVWSSPLPGDARRPMRYVNLMGRDKPHLLTRVTNNLGSETRLHYAPSTKFYLQDKLAGRPWATRLPFPVQVVERIETWDRVSRNRFVTRYAYHHGYFDGIEREFRGFGMVEQWDTEGIGELAGDGSLPEAANIDASSYVPPVLTRTWFHTGAWLQRDRVSRQFENEYYQPGAATSKTWLLPDTPPPEGVEATPEEEREACRALKGTMLRQEIYALDGKGVSTQHPFGHPYTVAEQNFQIRCLQPGGGNRHAVFFTHPREAITLHHERDPDDPRVQHALTLAVDDNGNVLREAAVGYGRQVDVGNALPERDKEKQRLIHITCTENRFTKPRAAAVADGDSKAIDDADNYRAPLPAESRAYELRKAEQDETKPGQLLFDLAAMQGIVAQAGDGTHDVPNHDTAFDIAKQTIASQPDQRDKDSYFRRLIEHVRTLYRKDDLSDLLPLGEFEALALPGEGYKLAFTPGLLKQVYQRGDQPLLPADPAELLRKEGGYVPDDRGDWWVPSGRVFHSPNANDTPQQELAHARGHFYLPHRYRDPFGADTVVAYDSDDDPAKNHDLFVVRTKDALGNTVVADIDYRVLQPWRMTDPNGNPSEARFDALGLVVGTAVMGKDGEPKQGDSFDNFKADLDPDEVTAYFDTPDPRLLAAQHLGTATTRIVYDLDRVPTCAATIARETHVSDLGAHPTKLQLSFGYSDGFGREVQKKIQAEPGPVPRRNAEGGIIVADGRVAMTDQAANPRWVGSGWTIYDNKGHPVRQFEPFFSDTHRFDGDVRIGVSPWLFHDPLGRVVATLHPNHTWEKVVFDPWQQTTYDVNDTVLIAVRADDPKRDSDATAFFGRLPDADYLPTWYELRTNAAHAAAFAIRYPGQTDRENEADAAKKAAAHAGTPTTAHFDALGRPFLTIARNRVDCKNHPLHEKPDEEFRTRVALDIEGNQREVIDERKLPDANNLPLGDLQQRIVMQYAYDMLGNRIHQLSMEAGARWTLNDVGGKPIRAWDGRGHNFTTTYDALRRPIEQYVRGTFSDPDPLKPNSDPHTLNPPNEASLLVERIEYGEPPPGATPAQEAEARRLNLRARIYRHSDSAGVVTNARLDANGKPTEAYDFKGNLLRSTRQLVSDYKTIPDWSRNPRPSLDAETFEGSTRYDALNRPIQSVAPRSSLGRGKFNIIQPVFNEANLLERVNVWLERATESAALLDPADEAPSPVGVANIDYDAKGQRVLIDYKTQEATVIRTTYAYDHETFRLTHLYTRRGVDPATAEGVAFTDDCDNPNPPPPATIATPETPPAGKSCGLQNLHYTYDPAGNITRIRDDAQQTLYFKNQRVEPSNDYVYDALYRLIQAEGREHLGQAGAPIPHAYNDGGRVGILSANPAGRFAPNDRNAMGRYTERYVYDAVGNFLQMQHARSDDAVPDWTRRYAYAQASLIEPGKRSNRLSSTAVGNAAPEPYNHDTHGNMLVMPQLHTMQWDYRDQLQLTQRQKVNDDDADGVERHGERTWYVYDASGQRVRKVTELPSNRGIKDERIYLGGIELFRSYQGAPVARTLKLERETLHVMDDEQRIAVVEMRTLGDEQDVDQQLIRYQFGNHLGSSSLELDEQAQIVSYEEYAPYGSSTYQAVRSRTETAKRYRYTGKERDEESGLYYHGSRYYASWLGRWTSYDPVGLSAGIDLYEYVSGNPVKLIDPDGNQECTMCDPKKTLGRQLLNALDEGIRSGDVESSVTARLLAGEFYKRTKTGPGGAFEYHGDRRKILDIGKKIGLTESESEELASMVRSFLPEDQSLGMDYAGRIGSEANLADRELADRLAVIGSQSTTFGSILASWAGAMGGNAEEMRRAGQAGDLIEGVAGGLAVVTNKQSRADETQDRKAGLEEHPPSKTSAPAKDVKPDVPTNALFRTKIKGPAIDSSSRGYDRRSKKHQQLLERSLRWWGEPGPKPDKSELDLGHAGSPHVTLRPGQSGMLKAERWDVNQARGRTEEKALANELRKRSAAAGLDPHDPKNPFFTRPPAGR